MTSSASTRDTITEVADQLLAAHGVDEVSMRDIVTQSDQRNMSAVQYHFGGRDGLLTAVFRRRLKVLNVARREYLTQIDRQGRGQELGALVEASIVPLAQHLRSAEGASHYARFAARMTPTVDFASNGTTDIGDANGEVIIRLRKALTHLSERDATERVSIMMNMMVVAFARYEQRREDGRGSDEATLDELETHLIEMSVGALMASHDYPARPPT